MRWASKRGNSVVAVIANNGSIGYFVTAGYFEETGWCDFSPSNAFNFLGGITWSNESSLVNIVFSMGDTDLRGNGASPAELLRQNRDAVVDLFGRYRLNDLPES